MLVGVGQAGTTLATDISPAAVLSRLGPGLVFLVLAVGFLAWRAASEGGR